MLVTGGSRGLGRAIALAFAEQGADVAINYRGNAEAADEVVQMVGSLGRRAVAIQGDTSAGREACEAIVAVDVAGLSYREAAGALQIKEATLTTRLHRARRRVARALTAESASRS